MDKKTIISKISEYKPVLMSETSHSAAVLVLIMYDEHDNLFLVVTKRAANLATYAGDYSFPGGIRESIDSDLKMTMEREVQEELALKPDCYQMIGQINDFIARFGNLVRPFVATISQKEFEKHHKNSQEEVAQIYYFPFDDVLKIESNESLARITKRHPSYYYSHDDVIIWGLTAAIIVHLSNIIYDLDRPVGVTPST